MAVWHDNESAREQWLDAPTDDNELDELLEVAREQVEAYAPETEPVVAPPARYRMAQLMQARNIFNSSISDQQGDVGGEGFATHVFPLDWTVKNMIRPARAVPVVA